MTGRETTLLLTATVSPMAGMKTAIPDPVARLNDYKRALSHHLQWLDGVVDRIVIAENSNADLSALKEVAHGKECDFFVV